MGNGSVAVANAEFTYENRLSLRTVVPKTRDKPRREKVRQLHDYEKNEKKAYEDQ